MSEYQWWAGRDDEFYTIGPCASRQEARSTAFSELDSTDAVYLIEAKMEPLSPPSADTVINNMLEGASDDGLFGDDYGELSGTKEQLKAMEDDLDEVLRSWFERHIDRFPRPVMFSHSRNAEVLPPRCRDAEPGDVGVAATILPKSYAIWRGWYTQRPMVAGDIGLQVRP